MQQLPNDTLPEKTPLPTNQAPPPIKPPSMPPRFTLIQERAMQTSSGFKYTLSPTLLKQSIQQVINHLNKQKSAADPANSSRLVNLQTISDYIFKTPELTDEIILTTVHVSESDKGNISNDLFCWIRDDHKVKSFLGNQAIILKQDTQPDKRKSTANDKDHPVKKVVFDKSIHSALNDYNAHLMDTEESDDDQEVEQPTQQPHKQWPGPHIKKVT